MSRGFLPPVDPATGEVTIRAGAVLRYALEFQQPHDHAWIPQDMEGRVFTQRVRHRTTKATLLETEAEFVTGADAIVRPVLVLTSEQTAALLPEGASLIDLEWLIFEAVAEGERDILNPSPFRVRA